MECRRLVIQSVDRFREERVLEKLWEVEGRIREDTEVGKEDSSVIALCASEGVLYECCKTKH